MSLLPSFSDSVLFVDDDAAVLTSGRQSLELAGFATQGCASGDEAWALLQGGLPAVLVTDVRMRGLDGLGLLEKARRLDPELPVILVTGHGDVSMAVQAIRAGAYDFVEKPFPAELLVDVVRRAFERRRLMRENDVLRAELQGLSGEYAIIGRTPSMERLRQTIAAVAATDADVLVMGETGTGKELVARNLHQQSARRAHHFVALNCGAMPQDIVESELFGHEAGAFTGAGKRRIGRIEHASNGTLFLDEIESMPLNLQVKMLRVLQERVVEPLGSNEVIPVALRVVAATKENLRLAAQEKRFREDLYYRLNVVVINIPPLRERRDDIPLLFQHFVQKAATRYGRAVPEMPRGLRDDLLAASWPGNVRELRNAADRFVLGLEEQGEDAAAIEDLTLSAQVDRFEKQVIAEALEKLHGDISSVTDLLGLPRKTLYDKMRRHGLTPADFRD